MSDKLTEGSKQDYTKPTPQYVPALPMMLVSDDYRLGTVKYEADNWRKGIKYSRLIGGLERHALLFKAGETFDPEDKQHHLTGVIFSALDLLEFELFPSKYKEFDDRPYTDGAMDHWHSEGLERVREMLKLTLAKSMERLEEKK